MKCKAETVQSILDTIGKDGHKITYDDFKQFYFQRIGPSQTPDFLSFYHSVESRPNTVNYDINGFWSLPKALLATGRDLKLEDLTRGLQTFGFHRTWALRDLELMESKPAEVWIL